MRGHEPIKTMRQQGATPRIVFVDSTPCQWECWKSWHLYTPHSAQVEIEPGDFVASLDLCYAVGLTVVVNGDNLARVTGIGRAFEAAGAARVVASTIARNGNVYAVTHTTDSAERTHRAAA